MAPGSFFRPESEVAKDFKTFQAKYPMYVIPVTTFLELGRLVEHSELYQQGLLTEWTPGLRVICVSHQWLANGEPDPKHEHYRVLKRSLERLMHGEVPSVDNYWFHRMMKVRRSITAKDWAELSRVHIWIDFCCMPQVTAQSTTADVRAAGKAVQSIPSYFERCCLMLVLAPVSQHHDTGRICNYASWRRRGWCRMELACATLAPQDVPIMVVNGAEATPFTIHTFDSPRLLPGSGEFSCCRLKHVLNGREIPCDRMKCGAVLERMLGAKAKQLGKEGKRLERHYWVSVWWVFLEGLKEPPAALPALSPPPPSPDELVATAAGDRTHSSVVQAAAASASEPSVPLPSGPLSEQGGLAALRTKLGWAEEDDRAARRTGFGLAHCAALADDAKAIRELAALGGCNFNQGLKVNMLHLAYMVLEVTPLMAAMTFAKFSTVEALLDAKADPKKSNSNAMDCLFLACCRGNTANVVGWLKRFPDWQVDRNDRMLGINPACLNALTGVNKAEILDRFLEHGISVRSSKRWGGEATMLCLMALCEDPDLCAVKKLIDQGCDPSAQWHSNSLMWRAVFKAFRSRAYFGNGGRRWTHEMAMVEGAAPLHLACKRGDVELVQLLVASGADVEARNKQGLTPRQVVEKFFGEVPLLLAQALDPAAAAAAPPGEASAAATPHVAAQGTAEVAVAAIPHVAEEVPLEVPPAALPTLLSAAPSSCERVADAAKVHGSVEPGQKHGQVDAEIVQAFETVCV